MKHYLKLAINIYAWLWIAIEPIDKLILGIRISFERSILVAERFLQELVRRYGKHPVSTDMVGHGIHMLVNLQT